VVTVVAVTVDVVTVVVVTFIYRCVLLSILFGLHSMSFSNIVIAVIAVIAVTSVIAFIVVITFVASPDVKVIL
jgi:hypothetical protein